MIINVKWQCPQCHEENLNGFTEPNENTKILDDIYYVYCSECNTEFEANKDNSKIYKEELP